jgi:hypothetical protein
MVMLLASGFWLSAFSCQLSAISKSSLQETIPARDPLFNYNLLIMVATGGASTETAPGFNPRAALNLFGESKSMEA